MALTSEQVDTYKGFLEELREALGTGALSIEYNGKKATYKSTREITQAIVYFENLLGLRKPTKRVGSMFRQ